MGIRSVIDCEAIVATLIRLDPSASKIVRDHEIVGVGVSFKDEEFSRGGNERREPKQNLDVYAVVGANLDFAVPNQIATSTEECGFLHNRIKGTDGVAHFSRFYSRPLRA
jgi:hypothetical protein